MKNLPPKKKLLLINDTTDWYHFGCTATSLALKENIIKLGYELTSVPITESYKLTNIPKTWEEFNSLELFATFKTFNKDIIALIEDNDIVIVNGEGTLHGLRPAPLGLLYLVHVAKTFMGKNVQIVNHSVYPQDDLSLDNPDTVNLYYQVYKNLDFVAIREPLSFKLMKELGVNCIESFDLLPVYIKDHYTKHNIKDQKTLLIAGSAAWLNLNILSSDKGDLETFENGLNQFIDYIGEMSNLGYKIQFLYGAKDYPSKDDRELIEYFKIHLKCNWQVITAISLSEWLSIIEQATLLVSGRFHHSIAAVCLNTPFIALNSNTPKIEGLTQALKHTVVINYSHPALKDKLLEITQTIQKQVPQNILDELCSKAMNNLNYLAHGTYSNLEQCLLDNISLDNATAINYNYLIKHR